MSTIAAIADSLHAYEALGCPGDPHWAYRPEARRLWQAHSQAVSEAVVAFAALNGWSLVLSGPKPVHNLGRGLGVAWSQERFEHRLADHALAFAYKRRLAAVVWQPYAEAAEIVRVRERLAVAGLALHVPPDPLASFHYPGRCLFLVVTLSGESVVWLPDQDGRLHRRWVRKDAG
jgi:hypothetical protein